MLYLDEVEVITQEDKEKIAKLGLKQLEDMPSGYYIYNPDTHGRMNELESLFIS